MERWRARSVPVQEHFESLEPVLALRYVRTSRDSFRRAVWMYDTSVCFFGVLRCLSLPSPETTTYSTLREGELSDTTGRVTDGPDV